MKKLLNRIFYIPKYDKQEEKSISRLLMPSVVGVLLCMICLIGTTWAWFSANTQSGTNRITAAHFSLSVAVTSADGAALEKGESGSIALPADGAYTVTLTADGTAEKGYAIVKIGDVDYYTEQILKGNSFAFTIQTGAAGTTLSVDAAWGAVQGENPNVIAEGAEIIAPGQSAPEPTETTPTEPSPTDPEDPSSTEEPAQESEPTVESTQTEPTAEAPETTEPPTTETPTDPPATEAPTDPPAEESETTAPTTDPASSEGGTGE